MKNWKKVMEIWDEIKLSKEVNEDIFLNKIYYFLTDVLNFFKNKEWKNDPKKKSNLPLNKFQIHHNFFLILLQSQFKFVHQFPPHKKK